MDAVLLTLLWVLNAAISFWNARVVGLAWVETKHAGGWHRFMAWMGAIMAAVGFTWCLSIVLGLLAAHFGWLTQDGLEVYFNLAYVFLIPPLLFAGYAIMLDSWQRAYRERTVANMGVAGYNTFANAYNTYNAIKGFGGAFDSVLKGFSKMAKNKDGAQAALIIAIFAIAVGGGIMLTVLIIRKYAAADEPLPVRSYA